MTFGTGFRKASTKAYSDKPSKFFSTCHAIFNLNLDLGIANLRTRLKRAMDHAVANYQNIP